MKYWMITNRNVKGSSLGSKKDTLTYWTSEETILDDLTAWDKHSAKDFKRMLIGSTKQFPSVEANGDSGMKQKHISLFIHGYNNDWISAIKRYQTICEDLFDENSGLGTCVLFS